MLKKKKKKGKQGLLLYSQNSLIYKNGILAYCNVLSNENVDTKKKIMERHLFFLNSFSY